MRILLDARTVGRELSGVGNYVLELIRAFAALNEEVHWDLCIRGESRLQDLSLDERFTLLEVPFSHESHPWGDLWEELALPRLAAARRASLLHGPAFLIPTRRMRVSKVVTIHDLVAFLQPKMIPLKYASYMRWQIRRAARAATRIIVVSESVARRLESVFGPVAVPVDRIHHGVSSHFRPPTPQRLEAVRKRYGLLKPYLLFVGNLEPRKNLPGLLRAFRQLVREIDFPLELVLAGREAWGTGALRAAGGLGDSAAGPGAPVRLLGYVPAEDLPALYAAARAFVFPSFWEGFGMPVLEAMACGTPVVASRGSSLAEVVGGAGVFVEANSEESIARGILEVIRDEERRRELIRRGMERARRFTWEKAARETLACYRAALGTGTR